MRKISFFAKINQFFCKHNPTSLADRVTYLSLTINRTQGMMIDKARNPCYTVPAWCGLMEAIASKLF
jgi:hypothetical protein